MSSPYRKDLLPRAHTLVIVADSPSTTIEYHLDSLPLGYLPEENVRIRKPVSYRGKRAKEGLFWMSTLGKHVEFESWFERDFLLNLDYSRNVLAVLHQPLCFDWPTDCERDYHVPDYFVRTGDGEGMLVDVRPKRFIDDVAKQQFALTKEACAEIGWEYEVFKGLEDVRRSNLLTLHKYSNPQRWKPPGKVKKALVRTFESHLSLEDGVESVSVFTRSPRPLILGYTYFLAWHRVIEVDVNRPLSFEGSWRAA